MSKATGDPAADLLASLRANSDASASITGGNRQSYPFTSAAVKSPQFQDSRSKPGPFTPPASSSDRMNRNSASGNQTAPDLLGLLKFGQPPTLSPQSSTPQTGLAQPHQEQQTSSAGSIHARGVSASDLVSSMMGQKLSTPPPRDRAPTPSSASTHQNSLLKLLNQTVSSSPQTPQPTAGTDAFRLAQDFAQTSLDDQRSVRSSQSPARKQSPIHYFGSKESTPLPFDPQAVSKSSPLNPHGSQAYINPFEHQSSSSPHVKKQRLAPNGEGESRKSKSPSPTTNPSPPHMKLTSSGNDLLQSLDTHQKEPQKEGRSRVEAIMGIGAPSRNTETVARALNEVGEQVDRQLDAALAAAEKNEFTISCDQETDVSKSGTVEEHVDKAAEGRKASEKTKPSAPTDQVHNVTDNEDTKSSAKASIETSNAALESHALTRQIKVYQFPMRPFVSIDLQQTEAPSLILREQSDLPVARFKKEFDQADRTLATATSEYIVYAMPKASGGVRVIEQESGDSCLLFPETQDRVFNVSISNGPAGSKDGPQNIIATGVSGSVYWTSIFESDSQLSQTEMQARSVCFPPSPTGSDSTSGGQLKTRAKKSSRHPEYFAVGRGKSIQIVFPAHARSSEYTKGSTVETEKYFSARSLKITTGKAGKDFTFSEDDTTIVTLDKAGKLRLWDIRDLTDAANASASRLAPVEVKTPILTFPTAYSSEKSWPTSVLFVDKLRPYAKGTALRYIIVGMKQNHSLQLWDLCLGKAVQELNFSHENETDAICSVAYHPGTGVIVVGHPTRNSVYFIHLSAPKYNLPNMSQAKFAQRLANKDSTLPKAEATAIMSGMREYSLGDKGQLRSVELTQGFNEVVNGNEGEEEPPLFELTVMHSKGVLCLGVKKEDLGWSKESRVLHPVDAEEAGLILVKDLREPSGNLASEPSSVSMNGDAHLSSSPLKGLSKSSSKDNLKPDRSGAVDSSKETEKKKNKKNTAADVAPRASPAPSIGESYAAAAQKAQSADTEPPQSTSAEQSRPGLSKHTSREAPEAVTAPLSEERPPRSTQGAESVSVGISGNFLNKEIKKIEQGISNEFNKVLRKELGALYKHISSDKRVQDAANSAKQEAVLRLVSSTLDENVEKSLSHTVLKSIKEVVLPSIENVTVTALNKQLSTSIGQIIQSSIPSAVKQSVLEAVGRTLQGPEMIQSVSEQVSKSISGHIERELSNSLNKTFSPTFQNLALSISQKISGDTERRVRDQLQQLDSQRRSDSAKIDQLSTLVSGLSETVHTMAAAQSQFQGEILKFQQKASQDGQETGNRAAPGHSPTPSESASMHVSPEQEEFENVTTLMNQGRYEDATITVSPLTNDNVLNTHKLSVASIQSANRSLRPNIHPLQS